MDITMNNDNNSSKFANGRSSSLSIPYSTSSSAVLEAVVIDDRGNDDRQQHHHHHARFSLDEEGNAQLVMATAMATTKTTNDSSSSSSSSSSVVVVLEPNNNIGDFYNEHCVYLPAMAGWFIFSACLSAYNKAVFGKHHFNFPCPLLLTSVHFCVQWMFSETVCALHPAYWGSDRISRMSWREWFSVSAPCGIVTSADVGLSNLSMVSITITFYTMVKSSTPIFVLLWAWLFRIERITWSLIGVVLIIAAGEFLTVVGEVDFDGWGFALCLSAAVMSGARWTLVQLKLQSMEPPLKTTIATMRLLAPSMFYSLVAISLAVEKPWIALRGMTYEDVIALFVLGLIGAFLAIFMILCEFYLIMHSSAIILMIGGVVKELITIFIGVFAFHDAINGVNLTGCFIVFLGVVVYKVTFHLNKRRRSGSSYKYRTMEDSSVPEDSENSDVMAADASLEGDSDDEEWNTQNLASQGKSSPLPLAATTAAECEPLEMSIQTSLSSQSSSSGNGGRGTTLGLRRQSSREQSPKNLIGGGGAAAIGQSVDLVHNKLSSA